MSERTLRGLSEIRHFLFRNPTPITFIDATCFQLLGMDEWVGGFRYINYSDSFDGQHPHAFVPPQATAHTFPFQTLEECNNHMLRQPEVREFLRRRGGGMAFFMMFDEETVELAEELGLRVILPPPEIRRLADSKLGGTRIGDLAGVPSVPNALGRVTDFEGLRALGGHLGEELVVQTPFGDSGTTTYFIRTAEDFARHAADITREPEIKVMKRVNCRSAAIEGCVTRAGTIVGPLLSELVGFPELTPHKGGWCGNEASPDVFASETRAQAAERTARVGDELARIGYRGYFELDYLIDQDTGELFLGEINPRLTGASSMTNLAAFAHADAPLFLFHLLEYSDVDFELDVSEINRRWSDPEYLDSWSAMILKRTKNESIVLTEAPPSGVWRLLPDDTCEYVRLQIHRRIVEAEDEAFFLRIPRISDRIDVDDDLGFLVVRGRLMTPDHQLTDRARRWITAIRMQFSGTGTV